MRKGKGKKCKEGGMEENIAILSNKEKESSPSRVKSKPVHIRTETNPEKKQNVSI